MPDDSRLILSNLLKDYPLPRMVKIRQKFPRPVIHQIPVAVCQQLLRQPICQTIRPGMKIAVTAGSRGIHNIALIIREVCSFLRQQGASPFIVPAMGTHGSSTAEGQRKILESYGITEAFCSAPIRSSMEVKPIGETEDGDMVYIDSHAAEADGIIALNRIAQHPDFSGPYESGLMKMMAIGLGKQYGTELVHNRGVESMARNIAAFGAAILRQAPVLFGLAILENAYHETCKILALTKDEIITREPQLLEEAKSLKGRLLFNETDLLIVDRIGKDISGGGMDFHIVGAFASPYATGGIKARRRIVLDLTEESQGAMNGLGLADATTMRCFERCDLAKSYINSLTCTLTNSVKIPLVLQNDKEAIQACLKYNGANDKENPKVIRIRDTNHIEEILISEAHLPQARANPHIEILSEPQAMVFGADGYFL